MLTTAVLLTLLSPLAFGFGHNDRVLLRDVEVLTLYYGRMTTARRTRPIPQLKCTGGSAGCSTFIPQVVQCYNRGFDGEDTQWECKCDMDNAYRFGRIEVACEGYDHPDDAFILKGSCGLEYTVDLTEEGFARKQQPYYAHTGDGRHPFYDKDKNTGTHLIILFVLALGVYVIYRMCLSGAHATRDDPQGPPPPPAGFRADYMPPPPPYESCASGSQQTAGTGFGPSSMPTGAAAGGNPAPAAGGGFWTGTAMGGVLGYLFGSRGNGNTARYQEDAYHQHYQRHQPYHSSPWSGGWTGGGSSTTYRASAPTPSTPAPSSSGTRTASGFGGTKRR